MPAGRPTNKEQHYKKVSEALRKFNPEVILKLEEAFSFDCTVAEACFFAGIGEACYYENVKVRPDLKERFEALRNDPVLKARQSVIKAFTADPNLALKYLERKRRTEFALRQELTGEDGKDLSINLINYGDKK